MDKQKSKFGVIELMPNDSIYGYVNVKEFSDTKEIEIYEDYIDMGYLPQETTYSVVGGSISDLEFKYEDDDGSMQEGIISHVNHGVLLMKTKLKKYVPSQDK